jgi:hypothetical protein
MHHCCEIHAMYRLHVIFRRIMHEINMMAALLPVVEIPGTTAQMGPLQTWDLVILQVERANKKKQKRKNGYEFTNNQKSGGGGYECHYYSNGQYMRTV